MKKFINFIKNVIHISLCIQCAVITGIIAYLIFSEEYKNTETNDLIILCFYSIVTFIYISNYKIDENIRKNRN